MIKDQIQKQESGDNSCNIQAQSIVINQGISYEDAKRIALDIYKQNFISLSEDAAALARERAEELTDNFLKKLFEEQKEFVSSMKHPGMQIALYDAQKAYAKTGDKDLESLLVNILVERAVEDKRSLKQITLDEAISVASKLTSEQLDTLTVIFVISRTKTYSIRNINSLKEYFETYILSFLVNVTTSPSCFDHLVYAGCGSKMETQKFHTVELLFRNNYPGIFFNGFTPDEFKEQVGEIERYSQFLMVCLMFPDKLQINALDLDVLEEKCTKFMVSAEDKNKLNEIFNKYTMQEHEIKAKVIEIEPHMEKLFSLWSSTLLSQFALTTVGIAIAQANLRSKKGIKLDLSIWVK